MAKLPSSHSDLVTCEEQGLYLEQLGASIKGTVLFVAADNLEAHSLAGFHESFTVNHMCRFCMATRDEMQVSRSTVWFLQAPK